MNEPAKKRNEGRGHRVTIGELITDPGELARLRARRGPDDGGAERIAGVVLDVVSDREARKLPTDLVKGILGLVELLAPEQRQDLVRRLQEAQPAAAP